MSDDKDDEIKQLKARVANLENQKKQDDFRKDIETVETVIDIGTFAFDLFRRFAGTFKFDTPEERTEFRIVEEQARRRLDAIKAKQKQDEAKKQADEALAKFQVTKEVHDEK